MNKHTTIKHLYKERAYLVRMTNKITEYHNSNLLKTTKGTVFLNLNNIIYNLKTTSKILSEIAYKNGLILIYDQSLTTNLVSNPSTINTWTKGFISNFKSSKRATLITIPSFVIAFPKTTQEAYYISTELNKKSILFTLIAPPHMRQPSTPYHIDAQTDMPALKTLYIDLFKTAITRGQLKRALNFKNKKKPS